MKNINYKKLAIFIAIPLVLGALIGLITMKGSSSYNGPVPRWLFPVVWSVLYILMGISSYIISDNKKLLNIYKINLIVNLLWPIIFFLFKLKVLAFFWILILILIVGYMIYKFYQENKLSSYLLIPYILWLVFASVILCGIVEYFSSLFMELAFNTRWWDYTGYFFNINGRVCLEGLLFFGFGCTASIYIVTPLLLDLFHKLDKNYVKFLTIILSILFLTDFVFYLTIGPNKGNGITSYDGYTDTINVKFDKLQ